ncbi:hypothetical protein HY489_02935 [Candidatus Woesearchaeota archaeon]|nr:hypothetical protein [Candidatus Woesearchaeota archaeon]
MSEKIAIMILGIVALIGSIGLVAMLTGTSTGAMASSARMDSKIAECMKLLEQIGNQPVPSVEAGLPCQKQPNGYCDPSDDCQVGIRYGKCDKNCNCVLTKAKA